MFRELNNKILKQASKLNYTVSEVAPSTMTDLVNNSTLKVWSGASDNTIWNDPSVNYAFRALHDKLHLITGLGFTPDEEIEIGRIQANQYEGLLADLVYIETTGQAEYFKQNGVFVQDQTMFTMEKLKLVA
jgi:hypothetical protein